jgi:hypothetical protein
MNDDTALNKRSSADEKRGDEMTIDAALNKRRSVDRDEYLPPFL